MKILYRIFIVSTMVFMGACSDMFAPNPEEPANQFQLDRVLNDPAFAEGIMLRAYLEIPEDYDFTSVATDDAVTNEVTNDYRRMATGEWSAIYNPITEWDKYDEIFHLNYFLSVVDDVNWSWRSDKAKELFASRFRGEALALRAYHNFMILQHHAGLGANDQMLGIPLVDQVLNSEDNWELPRSTFQESIDFIYNDIDQALQLLPETWQDFADPDSLRVFGSQNINRIDGKILKALRTRVALLDASPAYNSGEYDLVKSTIAAELTAPLLVEIGGASGLPSGGLKFYDNDNDINNAEILWRSRFFDSRELEQDNFPPSLFGRGRVNPTQNIVDAFPMANGYPISTVESGFDPANPYEGRDPRLAEYIIFNGNEFKGEPILTSVDGGKDGLNNTIESTRTGYYLKKLLRADVNVTPGQMNRRRHFKTYVRYTELFLNYAEMANEAWGPDADPNGYGFTARDIVAAIRERAGIDPADPYLASITSKEGMREMIRNERRIELSFEGFRFWDLRRWDAPINIPATGVRIIDNSNFETFEVERRAYEPFMIYGPIPQQETIRYTGLIQNKGY